MLVTKINGKLAAVLLLGGIALGVGLSTNSMTVAQEKTPDKAPAKDDRSSVSDADLRKQLSAPDLNVRLRAALTLAARPDEEAIGVLIDLLADLPASQRRLAEQALQELAEDWSPNLTLAKDDEVSRRIRKDAWAAWWRNTDGPSLLAALRKRTLSPEQTERVQSLIAQLGSKVFARRQAATTALVTLGPTVVPFLRQAMQDADLEQRRRIELCLEQIAKDAERTTLPLVAVRLLALRKPAGATEVLLGFLPFTDDEAMKWEVTKALKSLAVPGKPEPVLVRTLQDPSPVRRAVAAEVLAGLYAAEHRPALHKLLADPDAAVRLRVAIVLICAGDKSAVPVLIDQLGDLPTGELWQAEEILHRLACATAPRIQPGDDAAARAKYRDAWKTWWKDNAATTKLAAQPVPSPLLGYTVMVLLGDPNRGNSRVAEVDRNGKVRWQIDGINYPIDANVLPGNRVLISECYASRITERDFKGNILWHKSDLPAQPYNAQRLSNGNTFICTRAGLMEFDAAGKTVLDIKVARLLAACKTADGQMIYLTGDGACTRLDATGKLVKSFVSGQDSETGSWIDLTPRGLILVGRVGRDSLGEFDLQGKRLWQTSASTNGTSVRNGNVMTINWDNDYVAEFDRAGKKVWHYQAPGGYKPFRARKR
jgi:HEAT repeat protein